MDWHLRGSSTALGWQAGAKGYTNAHRQPRTPVRNALAIPGSGFERRLSVPRECTKTHLTGHVQLNKNVKFRRAR
jgi:hypothetical protein